MYVAGKIITNMCETVSRTLVVCFGAWHALLSMVKASRPDVPGLITVLKLLDDSVAL